MIVRTRDEVSGPNAGYRANGGAVALMLELLACHATLPAVAPLASYQCGREVKVLNYTEALRAVREVAENAGREPGDFALHSLRIGGMSTMCAGGRISDRVGQREGRWGSGAYKSYAVNNRDDSQVVSRVLANRKRGVSRRPGDGTVWGNAKKQRARG